ncbi:MAG: riboflavin synthase [Chloroflexi bacterium]|nr:riboflavin synthase [Chloroflexota bacterium]
MFTGIVEEVGAVQAVEPGRLMVKAQIVLEGTKLGDSIAVNGACLTVVALGGDSFSVEVMPETLRLTNLGGLRRGEAVNLERAVALGGRMGGHMVQGHVEGTGKVLSLIREGDAVLVRFSAPADLMPYIIKKGFVAVDGVSVTVVDCDAASFTVSLVGFTRANTNLSQRRPGDRVNLEADIIARYVERFTTGKAGGVTMDLLREQGFV